MSLERWSRLTFPPPPPFFPSLHVHKRRKRRELLRWGTFLSSSSFFLSPSPQAPGAREERVESGRPAFSSLFFFLVGCWARKSEYRSTGGKPAGTLFLPPPPFFPFPSVAKQEGKELGPPLTGMFLFHSFSFSPPSSLGGASKRLLLDFFLSYLVNELLPGKDKRLFPSSLFFLFPPF